jgi:hypothetical protein
MNLSRCAVVRAGVTTESAGASAEAEQLTFIVRVSERIVFLSYWSGCSVVYLSFLFVGDINQNPLKNTTTRIIIIETGKSRKNSPQVIGLSLKIIHLIISNNSTTTKRIRNRIKNLKFSFFIFFI